jgi:hypothetical protein
VAEEIEQLVTKFLHGFDQILRAKAVKPIVMPPRSANLNDYYEWFVRSIKTVAEAISIRYGSVLRFYTFRPRPPARPVVRVGHSFGGAVVIATGAVTLQVAGVVALAPQA